MVYVPSFFCFNLLTRRASFTAFVTARGYFRVSGRTEAMTSISGRLNYKTAWSPAAWYLHEMLSDILYSIGWGPLMGGGGGGPQCRLSILRNGNVPCHYFLDFLVDFKIVQCHLSILRKGYVPCHYI